ncbi:MAG TPA: hypothetical protein VFM68_03770 [Candidatus Saccharimonadales bacterium]|nr:hypothetical protein [Candidatus Saccharimonadales bacterium]
MWLQAGYETLIRESERTTDHIAVLDNNSESKKQLINEKNNLERQLQHMKPEIDAIEEELGTAANKMTEQPSPEYERAPYKFLSGVTNKGLGPLPPNIHQSVPTVGEVVAIKTPKLLLAVMLLWTIGVVLIGPLVAPWMLFGLGYYFFDNFAGVNLAMFGPIHVLVVACALFAAFKRDSMHNYFYGNTIRQVQTYRMGAESWTLGQRIYSCVIYTLEALLLFALYPFIMLLVMPGIAAMLLYVYLDEYHFSGSIKRATLISSKLHAAYLMALSWLLGAIILVPWIFQMIVR